MPVGTKQVSAGGAADSFLADAVNRQPDGSLLTLTGTADVLNPHVAQAYVITNASAADLTTLAAPTAGDPTVGGDDGKILRVFSTTAFAHRVTCTGLLQNGAGNANSVTFPAQAGAVVELMAFNGKWIVLNVGGGNYTYA